MLAGMWVSKFELLMLFYGGVCAGILLTYWMQRLHVG